MERRMRPMNLVLVYVHKKNMAAVKKVQFVSDRMLCIILDAAGFILLF
jgi:hypothetical protein